MRLRATQLDQLNPLTDEDTANRVASGDSGAFELLMRRHNQRLFRTARAVLSNDVDAMDALQEAYIRIYHGMSAFQEQATLVTWMSRIVFNEAVRFRTQRARIQRRESSDITPAVVNRHAAWKDPNMEGDERMRLFDEAMDMLSEHERGVLMLRIIHGLSTRETAASLGMTESNVKISLHRAKPKLKTAIEHDGADEIRRRLTFDGERCDQLVAAVFRQLEPEHTERA